MNKRWNDEESCWFVLRAQTKREHIAAKILSDVEGVEVFCPRIKFKKATRRGKVNWVEPLFPGYFFAKFLYPESYRQVTASHGVTGILGFGNEVPHLSEAIVENIREQARAHSDDDVIELKVSVEAGDEVEVADGPLEGISATVVEPMPASDRVRILIEILGNEQVVEVDLFSLILPKRPQI